GPPSPSLPQPAVPRPAPAGTPVASASPILNGMSRPRGAVLRAAPRAPREAQAEATGEHEGRATGAARETAVYSTYPPRYPQFSSRVGFVPPFRPLSSDEVHFILEHKWHHLGLQCQPAEFTDAEAIAAIMRITGGNFRLLQRLFAQIERILQINELRTIT